MRIFQSIKPTFTVNALRPTQKIGYVKPVRRAISAAVSFELFLSSALHLRFSSNVTAVLWQFDTAAAKCNGV